MYWSAISISTLSRCGFHDDGLVVEHGLAAIEMLDELGDAAGVAELSALGFAGLGVGGALVGERDLEALVEEGHFAQALGQRVVVVFGGGEDGLVGQEVNLGAALLAGAGLAQIAGGQAATEIHLPGVAVAPDLDVEFLRERVDAADADAVQAAGDFVGGGVEFSAGVQLGEDDLDGGHHLAVANGHHVDGNAAAIVDDGDGVIDVDDDVDFFGVAGERFVDGVVDYFVDKMVQPHLAGGADVHGRPKANSLKAFEDLDVFAGVLAVVFGERVIFGG